MSKELKKLLDQIEELRLKMENLWITKGKFDYEVLAASQELDILLNNYYKHRKRK